MEEMVVSGSRTVHYLAMPRDSTAAPDRRRGGRAARVAKNEQAVETAVQPRRRIPTYELVDEDGLDALERHADWILGEVGVEFRGDDEALDLFRSAGAGVDGERVLFEPGLARHLCSTAPSEFRMHGRDPRHTVTIGGDHVVFSPAYGPPFVTDLDRGRRYASLEDFENFVKLTYATPWLHHSGGTICEPVDVPVNKRHLDMVYAHLRWSTKPLMGSVTSPDRAEDSIEMARLVFGSEFLEHNCVIQGNINVNSPLVFDDVMSGTLKAYARANQGCVISPFIIGGAMGPVTQPALLAQAHAEAMVGIALSQLVRPGSPMVYGNFLTTMDLRSGAPTFGTPEAVLATYAIGQLCRRLGLPLRCGGHYTASKTADAQAMQESADAMGAALLAGANFVHQAAGWLEGGLTIGYEKFVMDADHLGMLHRTLRGLDIDENGLAAEAYREAGPGITFLGTAHTLANFETANHPSTLPDTNSFEQWTEDGGLDMQQRASARWKQVLADYEPPAIDPSVDDGLRSFVAEKKASMDDAWY
ncbi:MAG: trimethylamine methyltransferase family protein [Actinomycetota bacterium]|nr:trimethylamine methyltransferase family protein [Actinomycetota bacterium]MEE3252441.1 trimethylamine methyltransferase family protein [Actinomycetota bacterium]